MELHRLNEACPNYPSYGLYRVVYYVEATQNKPFRISTSGVSGEMIS
jgi:hypothetical protein